MRRFRLAEARRELTAALRACPRRGDTPNRVAILNNLGITANQQNDYAAALEYFREAEERLTAAGERRGAILVACNRSIILAKLGDRSAAEEEIEGAVRRLPYYPGKRLEFFVAYARGTVAHHVGQFSLAITALTEALPLGRELGDRHMVQYGEIYLAEAHIFAAEYRRARDVLRKLAARTEDRSGDPLLVRMVHSRLLLVDTILGRKRAAARAQRVVDATPRTHIAVLEAWNDLHCGAAKLLASDAAGEELVRRALEELDRLAVPFGVHFARLTLLAAAVASGTTSQMREALAEAEGGKNDHQFLAVLGPLAAAEASWALGQHDAAERFLLEASGAIVGSPFLELDWRIELLRARFALSRGDLPDARRNLQRSLHARDLILERIPTSLREGYLAHPRFDGLREIESRLHRSPRAIVSTEGLRRAASFEGMIGQSDAMVELFGAIDKIAGHEIHVLIRGETGTGKELVARAIHRRSTRSSGPFFAVHCASLQGEIFEADLFGVAAGAYTGADEDRPGLLDTLAGGTLLLDEIGQLPAPAQAALLRVLDTGQYRALGSVEVRRADVRVLASTTEDLAGAVESGRFRADLFHRVSQITVEVPPLSGRRDDVVRLARHFLEMHAQRLGADAPTLTNAALDLLGRRAWPGNIRELEGAMVRVVLGRSASAMDASELARLVGGDALGRSPEESVLASKRLVDDHDLSELKRMLEREYLTRVFFACEGDARRMMAKLGVKRTRLYTWFRQLELDIQELRGRLGE